MTIWQPCGEIRINFFFFNRPVFVYNMRTYIGGDPAVGQRVDAAALVRGSRADAGHAQVPGKGTGGRRAGGGGTTRPQRGRRRRGAQVRGRRDRDGDGLNDGRSAGNRIFHYFFLLRQRCGTPSSSPRVSRPTRFHRQHVVIVL